MSITDGTIADQTELRKIYQTIPASYVVYKSGSTYYANATAAGGTDYSGTDAATVIQDAIDASPSDGCVSIKGFTTLTSGITIDASTHGDFSLVFDELQFTMNADALVVDGGATQSFWRGSIIGKELITTYPLYTHSALKLKNVIYGKVDITQIYSSQWGTTDSVAVHILGDGSGCYWNDIRVQYIYAFETAILVESTPAGFANVNSFHSTSIDLCKIGVNHINNGTNTSGNSFYDVSVTATSTPTAPWGDPTNGYIISDDTTDFFNCITCDVLIAFTDVQVNAGGYAYFFGGQLIHHTFVNNGILKLFNVYGCVTENSGSSTGTGAQQTIAHGLATTPTKVILWDIESGASPYQSASADATNIYVTATNNQDWGWEATYAP